jgi:peptidoglycan/LPS O-acetylase OafA/YrhL
LRVVGLRADLLFWASLTAVVASILLLANNPGAWTIVPVAATIGIIVSANAGLPRSARTLVALRPVQWTGDISYALYLWHWPVLVFAPFITGVPSETWFMVLLLALAVVLSWATTRFVENPVRRTPLDDERFRTRRRTQALAVSLGLVTILAVAGSGTLIAKNEKSHDQACIERNNTRIVTELRS